MMDPIAEFAFFQKDTDEAIELRFYKICGNHRLNGSHVSLKTVIDEGIEISDLNESEIKAEYQRVVEYLRAA